LIKNDSSDKGKAKPKKLVTRNLRPREDTSFLMRPVRSKKI